MYVEVKTRCDFRKYTFLPYNYRHDLMEYTMVTIYRFGSKIILPRIPSSPYSMGISMTGYMYTLHYIFRLFVRCIMTDAYENYMFKPNGGYPWHQ
jgi:hypothetical protein